jgi:hypothetical protein
MAAPEAIFREVFMAPAEIRRNVFQNSLRQSWSDDDYIDVLIEMSTDGPLSARQVGKWLNALNVGFGKFARLQGIAQPELLIIEIGTGSFRTKLRKLNDVIALPGFLLGIYALIAQGNPVDEETLRRVLAEQRPAATATCDLFLKDKVTEMTLSVGERPLGTITLHDAKQFRERASYLSDLPYREDEPKIPEIPTWEAVLMPRPKIDDGTPLLENTNPVLGLAPPRPNFREGTVFGTFLWIDRDAYVRLEGMDGVLVPVKARSNLLAKLEHRGAYRFIGSYHARADGLRTSFHLRDAIALDDSNG